MNPTSQPRPAPATAPRKPPTPPPMMTRIVLLCLRPEFWPQAARYPLSATLWATVVAAVVMSALVSFSASHAVMKTYDAFAAGYDARFFPMELSGGKLSRVAVEPATAVAPTAASATEPALAAPTFTLRNIPYWSAAPWTGVDELQVIFDPENKAQADVAEGRGLVRVTDTEIVTTKSGTDFLTGQSFEQESRVPIGPLVGDTKQIISGATLKNATERKSELAVLIFLVTFFLHCLSNLAWAVLLALAMIVVVRASAARLAMPWHVAFRIGLAVTVPLLVLGGFLEATGLLARTSVPVEVMPVFWVACAVGMAFWSGMLANRIYAPRRRAPRGGM